ncbi:MAG: 3-phosphoshikimate 1-carboxyvinyltransferase [Rhodomicrobium sp.]
MSQLHSAPKPLRSLRPGALQGTVSVPGDKSISHRSLILGALAEGHTVITGLLESEDVVHTAKCLLKLGVQLEKRDEAWFVIGSGLGGLLQPDGALDFGNSGTAARLMMGVVAGHSMRAVFTGDDSLKKRPMGRVLDPLRQMGLDTAEEGRTTLPLTLLGTSSLVPLTYHLPVPSAQVKSAVLLAGLLAPGRTTVIENEPTRDHTEKMLSYFGVPLSCETAEGGSEHISVEGRKSFRGKPITVPGDPSSAAFLAGAAILCPGSDVIIRNVLVNPTRTGFYKTLVEMGADISFENKKEANGEAIADIHVKAGALRGVPVPPERAPSMIDEYPILATLAAFAQGETVMEGLAELRVKESDRLAAMVAGLNACGVQAASHGDALKVRGSKTVRGGALIATHMDHRIAMAFLVLGLATVEPVTVDDASMIATSFPEFRDLMQALGASFEDAGANADAAARATGQ